MPHSRQQGTDPARASRGNTGDKRKPVHEVRIGAIKAAVWANDTEFGVRHNVTFVRLYRDNDQWKSSDSFGRDDLPVLSEVARQAWLWIYDHGRGDTQS